jgi:tetratricopeptide (TPR) repeat protein
MKRWIHAGLITLLLAQASVLAQNDARELWLVRAQNLTSDLLKDAADLSSMQRAVLLVKLAQRWWRDDPSRARSWIIKAIEVVEQFPNKETPEEREERLDTARILLTIVTPLDAKLSKRLLTVMTSAKSTDNDRSAAANALIDAAVAVIKEDPKRAGELVALALRTGVPNNNIHQLFYELRRGDPKLADSLFVQALALAKQNPQSRLLNSLLYVAFPALRGQGEGIPVPPDPLRRELLQIVVGLLNANPGSGENSNCGLVSWVAQFFTEIERLLPKQGLVLRHAINTCHVAWPVAQQRMEDVTRTQPLDTIESLLRAAADAKDSEVRADYDYRAAALAAERREYERALKLLDDMPKEQRGESWDSWRWVWASDGAIEHYKNGRFREMNLMLDAVPSDLQPLAKASFVVWVPQGAISETAPLIQILNDALKGLRRSSIPDSNKYNWYFSLLRSTIKYQPADANAVLKDAIASFNKVKDEQPLNDTDWLKWLGASLVEMDEFVVKDALASVTMVSYRAQLRLALLDATLKRLIN